MVVVIFVIAAAAGREGGREEDFASLQLWVKSFEAINFPSMAGCWRLLG
jgi:hypothetical protein